MAESAGNYRSGDLLVLVTTESRRGGYAPLAIFVAAVMVLTACGKEAAPLKDTGVKTRTVIPARVGQLADFGFVFEVGARRRVRFVSVRVLGTPRDLSVVKIWGDALTPGEEVIGALRGDLVTLSPDRYVAQPVTAIEFVGGDSPHWQLVVTLKALRAGSFRTKALEITYESDDKVMTEQFPYVMQIRSLDCSIENAECAGLDEGAGSSAS